MSGVSVSIVTVTYNSECVIGDMLASLPSGDDVEVVVVDNASDDETVSVVRAVAPTAVVIRNVANLGFASAVNLGVASSGGEVVLLINPDARITREAMDACVSAFDAPQRTGVVAPLVVQPQGRLKTLEAGHGPSLWRVFVHWTGLSRLAPLSSTFEGSFLRRDHVAATRTVGWVSGSCMFVARTAWNTVGGMSERYFMYAEDLDLCLRMAEAGYRVTLIPHVTATHEIGGSSITADEGPGALQFAWFINTFDVYRSHYQPGLFRLWLWRTTFSLGLLSRALGYHWRGRRLGADGQVNWRLEARKFYRSAWAMNAEPLRPACEEPRRPPS